MTLPGCEVWTLVLNEEGFQEGSYVSGQMEKLVVFQNDYQVRPHINKRILNMN